MDKIMKEKRVKSAIPFYGVGLCWIVCSFILPMYRMLDFFIAIPISLAVFLILSKIIPDKVIMVEIPVEPIRTGDKDLDQLMEEGMNFIKQIHSANVAIDDEKISEQIERIEGSTRAIFDYIKENPEKKPQIRKMMTYYLPTLLKLLTYYDKYEEQQVKGKTVLDAMENLENMVHTMADAFDKQLDHLHQNEALDISTDITVLEKMLEQEGLTDTVFHK